MSDLVTGEAVVLDLRLARLASRSVGFAIDVAVQAALLLLFLILLGTTTDLDETLLTAISLVTAVAVLVGYPVLFETLTRGRSLGKLALGLRVVRVDGGPVRFRQALVRGLTGFFVDFWVLGLFGAVALFVSLASAKGRRVGDYLAGTVVVHERMPRQRTEPVGMPPELAAWAAGLNVAAVPNDLALAVRQYLGRWDQLDIAARDNLGARLAAEVGGHLGVPLPADGWTARYLAAVLAERRVREQGRAWSPAVLPGMPTGVDAPEQPAVPPDNPFAPPV